MLLNRPYSICEVSFRFKCRYSNERVELIRNHLKASIPSILRKDKEIPIVTFQISISEGSIKAKAVFYGAMVFTSICNYGSLREGLGYLIHDARSFGVEVVGALKQSLEDTDLGTVRTRVDTGLLGKLERTIARMENLVEQGRDRTQLDNEELERLKNDLIEILCLIENRQEVIRLLPQEIRSQIPDEIPLRAGRIFDRYALKPKEEDEDDSITN